MDNLTKSIDEIKKYADKHNLTIDKVIENFSKDNKDKEINKKAKSSWDIVQLARDKNKPKTLDLINYIFDDFLQMHGDRLYGDDKAIVGGIALLNDEPVTVIGHQKGKTTDENIERNFGMAHPEGYRKALRLMKQADKFNRPIITFIDTPGAFCGLEAEKRGQSEAIAKNLFEMADFDVPILTIIIGEGGSGGALGLAVANDVWMLQNSIYSVISPEGFSSILLKDASKASKATDMMKIVPKELKRLGLIDKIIKEPVKNDLDSLGKNLKKNIENIMKEYKKDKDWIEKRYKKFREYGEFNK